MSDNTFLFRFDVTSPSDSAIKLVAGSIDENLCGQLERNNIRFHTVGSNRNRWEGEAKITVAKPEWLHFYVMFAIGVSTSWRLEVFKKSSDGSHKSIYAYNGTTVSNGFDGIEQKVSL